MNASLILVFCAAMFFASLILTGAVRHLLARRAILDHPNERSSHDVPTPRGGGWAIVPVVAVGWVLVAQISGINEKSIWLVTALAAALGCLSWIDDLRGLPPALRLAAQAVAVGATLAYLPANGPYFGGVLPPVFDILAAALLWIWYINLFNFMDGIDGIAAVETAGTGLGIAAVALLSGLDPLAWLALLLAASAAGFLPWNWHPAKIFLGDIGSVPLGFLLGWLLLGLAANGQWAAALVIPAYYLADSTITLLRRALRGEKVWQAHREHFYQQAIRRGASHARVSCTVLAVKFVLVGLAVLAVMGWQLPALAASGVIVAGILLFLRGGAGVARDGPS
ncbi:MAG: glycosyltransferase family 4 protein [Rhodospirillales bacterium]|nr:glycosyltransferase family 4 protein [Rhodospirillales bacterium]